MIDAVYVLNENPGGIDVIHRNPHEECNTDDAKGITPISPDTAVVLLVEGHARACQHCLGSHLETGGQTLDVQNHQGDPVTRMPETSTAVEEIIVEKEAPTPDVEITEGSDTDEAADVEADEAEEELNEEADEADKA